MEPLKDFLKDPLKGNPGPRILLKGSPKRSPLEGSVGRCTAAACCWKITSFTRLVWEKLARLRLCRSFGGVGRV